MKRGSARARCRTANGDDGRRCGARRDAGVGAFDAEHVCAPTGPSAATLWSPETALAAMAHGGDTAPDDGGEKRRPRQRHGTESRGESGQGRALAHHSSTRLVGEVGGSPETTESTTKLDDGDAVFRRWRRNDGFPSSGTRGGGRGRRDAASGHGDASEEALNGGNGRQRRDLGFRHSGSFLGAESE